MSMLDCHHDTTCQYVRLFDQEKNYVQPRLGIKKLIKLIQLNVENLYFNLLTSCFNYLNKLRLTHLPLQ